MPGRGAFLDSNVLCYLFGADQAKADRAGELLEAGPVISVQVLAEICNVASRKTRLSWTAIEEIVEVVAGLSDVVTVTVEIQAQARQIAARTGYTIYDAQILAAAAHAGCALVWSEDMQDGHSVSAAGKLLEIRNPFAGSRDG